MGYVDVGQHSRRHGLQKPDLNQPWFLEARVRKGFGDFHPRLSQPCTSTHPTSVAILYDVRPVQQGDDGVRRGGVESGCRLVQVEHGGRDDELHADVGALSLSSGHPADKIVPNLQEN